MTEGKNLRSLTEFAAAFETMAQQSATIRLENNNLINLGKNAALGYKREYTVDEAKRIIMNGTPAEKMELSNVFFNINGIYKLLILYYSILPLFIYSTTPVITNTTKLNQNKMMTDYVSQMNFMDNLNIAITFRRILMLQLIHGVYYGIFTYSKEYDKYIIFDLPIKYCRVNTKYPNDLYAVEFDVSYFSALRKEDREAVLLQYPESIIQYYTNYLNGIVKEKWMYIPPNEGVAFVCPKAEPFFLYVITDLINLDRYKSLEYAKDLKELTSIITHKLPIGKDDDLIFDLKEATELHSAIVQILKHNSFVDVVTAFGDIKVNNLGDGRQPVRDNLTKVQDTIYFASGVSPNLFAADSNTTLQFSIEKDNGIIAGFLEEYNL